MSLPRGRSPFRQRPPLSNADHDEEDAAYLSTRQIEAFGRTLNATASQLIGGETASQTYQQALGEIHRELRRPMISRSVFALAKTNPRELMRSTFSTSEIQHRALAHLPDELLNNIPDTRNSFSLFQGFEATRPEDDHRRKKKHGRHGSKGQKLLEDGKAPKKAQTPLSRLENKKDTLDHRLEMMEVRKNMAASEIVEIDKKMANLATMRRLVVERLASLELEETDLEQEVAEVSTKLEDLKEDLAEADTDADKTPPGTVIENKDGTTESSAAEDTAFMSQSIYQQLPSPKSRKRKTPRRISTPILHEHLEPGTQIKELQAHTDTITSLDFDVPFGTMVTAALDDTLRVWNLNTGRCIGLLEGHLSSVRCVQVEDNIVASGSNDATVRLWDLSQADYTPTPTTSSIHKPDDSSDPESSDTDLFPDAPSSPISTPAPSASAMADCPLFTLSSHVAEVTALHFQSQTLVSGSSDKTLRQWDLTTGRCVQTLDVLWAAAQASSTSSAFPSPSPTLANQSEWFRPGITRTQTASAIEADFVGALQVFQSAVACGTADSVVRLWDLRSGGVQRQLIGHTGAVTCLQFDDVHLVTGSRDRSIRIWDLRTGSIFDAFAYDSPITSMQFDLRRICAAAGENVVKVYDKADGHQWDCGPGVNTQEGLEASIVENVRIKDGYMVEGRRDGKVGIWAC
ncbi:Mitochondrial division protein 1 [Sphaceloma murrayae]|uniref:Mitochondrial division protein 1 n=1 Tax=Sphaceloma murrayae TaxID=2082308 RepID=A0A2K1QTK8_9PEZI|nr:Mitochondrial division protein 1 [Sphaceloma murrayae]